MKLLEQVVKDREEVWEKEENILESDE